MKGFLRGCIEVPAVGILLLGLALVALSRKIMDRSPIIALCAAGAMLFACKHSEKLELSASGHTEAIRLETSQSDTVTTRSEGPERTTTTVEEFVVKAPTDSGGAVESENRGPTVDSSAVGPGASTTDRLLRRTVTIAERGPVLQETHLREASLAESDSHAESVSKAVHEEKTAPAGCGFAGSLLAWAVPLVLALLAWKFRALIPWWPK